MKYWRPLVCLGLFVLTPNLGSAADVPELAPVGKIELPANLDDADNLSGIAWLGNDQIAVCTDEVAHLDVLTRADNQLKLLASPALGDADSEIDLEGLASDEDTLYALGSHSLARKQPDPDKSYERNRERILELNEDANRDQLFRLTMAADGTVAKKDSINLQPLFRQHAVLRPFLKIASKENGVDLGRRRRA